MHRELFGAFGGIETFERHRSTDEFDEVLAGSSVTVGIRDSDLGTPGWSAQYAGENGICVVWGEAYVPGDETNAARWLLERYEAEGVEAVEALNGSYLAVVDPDDSDAFVATDPVRTRECFYTDDADETDVRVFGTDSAAVARTIRTPSLRRDGVLEFLHLGVTLGEKTGIEELHRLPLDSRLTSASIAEFDRFVYRPRERDREFDYVEDLAARLRRALERRSALPGKKGLLLSAGYDSRIVLSAISDVERCYTVGSSNAQEVAGAKRVAEQYGTAHTTFPPDERYLFADETKVRYSQGIKESLHIHHAGYADELDVDTIYHGLLCDTFFRGHFTAKDGVDVLGKRIPFDRLDPDPDPVEVLVDTFGYSRDASLELASRTSFDVDPESFVRTAVAEEFEAVARRAETTQNTLTCCGIANQPSIPFHNHLSDHFLASFLAADAELIEWHLRTPPAYRTTDTFLRACERIDDDVLRHRPPDRPHDSYLFNEVEGFIRRKAPFLSPFEPPWPDRERLFERHDLDRRLLPELEHVHGLPVRHKLRLNDLRRWLDSWSDPRAPLLPWLQMPEWTTA